MHLEHAGAAMLQQNGAAGGSHESEEGGVGFDRPDHAAVFDLSMEYDDDDVLLDWEQYAGMPLSSSFSHSSFARAHEGLLYLAQQCMRVLGGRGAVLHAGGRKHSLFGQDVTWLAKLCPWCPCWIPPEWCAQYPSASLSYPSGAPCLEAPHAPFQAAPVSWTKLGCMGSMHAFLSEAKLLQSAGRLIM